MRLSVYVSLSSDSRLPTKKIYFSTKVQRSFKIRVFSSNIHGNLSGVLERYQAFSGSLRSIFLRFGVDRCSADTPTSPPSTTPRHSFSARSHSGRICKSLQQPQDIICFKTTTAIWFTSRVLNAIKRVNLFLNSFHQTLFQRLDRLSWLRQLSPQLTSGHLQTT